MDGFRELNLRTYINRNDRPGVYFLSIECPAAYSDWIARQFFGAPYFEAQIATYSDGTTFHFAAERTQKDRPPASFFAKYRPESASAPPVPGSLDHFLVERYCLYFVVGGKVFRGDIQHQEWLLHNAELELDVDTVSTAAGLQLGTKADHVGFVQSTDTLIFPPVLE